MAKDMFDVSDDAWGMPQEAVKEFTDREDPQEAFERKFRVLSENWKKSYYVLCYYGIGGIGKTCFVNKLCRVIRGVKGNELRLLDKIDCNYIRYDFGAEKSGTDKLSILLSFRKQLGEADKDFKFFRFDSAVLLYAKRSGVSIEKDETAKALLEGNPWLDAVLSTVGTVPGIGWVSGVIQAINKSAKTVRDSVSKHMDEARYRYHLNEIDSLEMPELLKKLHEYFIWDMRYNMQQVATKPVIVFMDTYERYIDTLNREISMITEDYWLRKGNRSVIRSIPGILWVITGREKLYWAEDDAWGEPKAEGQLSQMSEEEKDALAETHLEQHLLGDLCQKDATGFLKKAGITNDALCIQLYKLTNGTPLFLDICVDTYYDLCSRGIPTEPEQFGEDLTQLISRYLSNMTNENREMTYFLACLGKWNNEDVQRIAKEATTLRWYTYAKYESFVEHSFIIKNPNGSYYMHETVRSAALKNADEEIVEEIGRIKLSVLQEKVEADQTLEDNETFAEYIKELAKKHLSYEEFCEHYLGVVFKKVISLLKVSKLDDFYIPAKELFSMVTNLYPGTKAEYIVRIAYGVTLNVAGYAKEALEVVSEVPLESSAVGVSGKGWREIKLQIAEIYSANGMHQESVNIREQVLEERKRLLGEDHPDTLDAMFGLALSYGENKEYGKELVLYKQLSESQKRVLGEDHLRTLATLHNLAISYGKTGDKERELELQEQTLEKMKQVLGEDHPVTLLSKQNLANSYGVSGKYKKAQELYEQIAEVKKRVLIEEHPENGKLESLVEEIEKMEILADVLEVYQARERSMQPVPPTPEERKVAELRALLEEQNNPTLQCELAARHLEGRGIELSAKKALELYRMAAEQGSCAALFCQAILHLQGRGTKQDEHAAFDLFEKAAEQNHANAQFMISMFYGTGRGVEKDEALAAQWYEKALQNGQLKKAYDINRLFLDCEDARSNLGLLVAWHEHTSYQEFPVSRCNFGYMYETGRGVEADIERAKEWYEKAAGQGDAVAAKLLEDLKKPGLFGKLFGKPRKK